MNAPPDVSPPPESKTSPEVRQTDRVLAAILYGILALLLFPVNQWLVGQVLDHDQLLQGLALLALLGTTLYFEEVPRPRFTFTFSRRSLLLGVIALLATALAAFTRDPLLMFVAYVAGIGSFALYAFGGQGKRLVTAVVVAFGAWLGFSLVFQSFDWPLRELAGRYGVWALEMMGHTANLQLAQRGNELYLLMTVNGYPFEVAAECNGFGMLTSSILLAIGLGLYRPLSWLDRGLYVVAAAVMALAGNVARIVVICLLAPHVGDQYFLMHEIVGVAAFIGTLAAIWFLIGTHKPRSLREAEA